MLLLIVFGCKIRKVFEKQNEFFQFFDEYPKNGNLLSQNIFYICNLIHLIYSHEKTINYYGLGNPLQLWECPKQ